MKHRGILPVIPGILALLLLACGGSKGASPAAGGDGTVPAYPPTDPLSGPAAGNPDGRSLMPAEALAADVSHPDHVIGTGTPESCTAEAFIAAVAQGGRITFNGGTKPFTITLSRPAKVFNDKPDVVIDGGGLATLSGGGTTRILYLNTCDPNLVWTTDHCQNQEHPQLTMQNLTFIDGNAAAETQYDGGGAICLLEQNQVNAFGSAIFFVSNNGTGTVHLEDSLVRRNLGGSWYVRPGLSMDAGSRLEIVNTTLQ